MCFSASASFGAGVLLTGIGIASIKATRDPSQKLFASIPFLFGVQQITEGFVWLSLSNPDFAFLKVAVSYQFLFFAQILWPIWVPLSVIQLVSKEKRKKQDYLLVGIGTLVAAYMASCLLRFPVEASIQGFHISYKEEFPPVYKPYIAFLYILATIAPPFFSRIKGMWTLGTAIFISCLITAIFYTDYLISVWCFFASVISINVYAILYYHNRSDKVIAVLQK